MTDGTLIQNLPFRLEFIELPDDPKRPEIQSYSWMIDSNGDWYIVGGRLAGLHQFGTSGQNFPKPNQALLRVDARTLAVEKLFDLTLLDPDLGDPLMSTNQQSYYDRTTDEWLLIGGYGYDRRMARMRTFDTLIRIPVQHFMEIVLSSSTPGAKASAINNVVHLQHDPFFAVTGGVLRRLGGRYLLTFGQGFQGPYDPFVEVAAQEYTNAVRFFRLDPRTGQAMGLGELVSADLDEPFHRRDGPIIDTVDPATGAARVTAFGGVFPPGKLDGYLNPVNVDERNGQLTTSTDRSVQQLFNQYECPTIVVWDPARPAVYVTFFGGISRYYFHQTAAQKAMYETVTAEGRNDGLPFVSDISTLVLRGGGTSSEYISPDPIPGGVLRGTSTEFIPKYGDAVSAIGTIDLSKIPASESVVIGYVYGGIEADFPLPKIPNFGTAATGAMYRVEISNVKSKAQIPASQGHRADGVFPQPAVSG